jgi:hypothetical protein
MNDMKVALSAEEKDRLDHDGFLILENFVEPGKLAALRRRITELFAELGDLAGYEFKQEPLTDRLANLVDYDAQLLLPSRSAAAAISKRNCCGRKRANRSVPSRADCSRSMIR